MGQLVIVEIRWCSESFVTNFAFMWFFAGMNSTMSVQRRWCWKCFRTDITLMRFFSWTKRKRKIIDLSDSLVHVQIDLPVCVRTCLARSEGLSNGFEQTWHGHIRRPDLSLYVGSWISKWLVNGCKTGRWSRLELFDPRIRSIMNDMVWWFDSVYEEICELCQNVRNVTSILRIYRRTCEWLFPVLSPFFSSCIVAVRLNSMRMWSTNGQQENDVHD